MTAISINFDALRDASSKASDVARQLNNYADSLNSSVERPLGRLTGGSTSNTSSASSIAAAKARDLRNRSDGYRRLSTAIQSFSDSARQVDIKVNRSITSVANGYAADLPFWGKVGRGLYNIFNGVLGATEVGSLLKQVANWMKAGFGLAGEALKKAYDWFRHGSGRYILAGVIAFAGLIGALATFVGTLPVSGIFAAIMAVAAGIALVKSFSDMAVSVVSAVNGCLNNNTEPGYARYLGSASSLSDYMRMNTRSKTAQTLASWFDTAGEAAGIFVAFGNLFKVKQTHFDKLQKGKAPSYKASKETLSINLHESLGFRAKTELGGDGARQLVREGSKIKYEWNCNNWGISFMESDKPTGSPVMSAKDLVIEAAKNKIDKANKFAKPIKNISSTVQFFATGDQTMYRKISGEDSAAGKVWSLLSSVIKTETSIYTGVTLPKTVISTVDFARGA